jgi:geranylgeranyl pyrophosphate synthase
MLSATSARSQLTHNLCHWLASARLVHMPTERETRNSASAWALPGLLGITGELELVSDVLRAWTAASDPEVLPMVRRQLSAQAKYFRPVTVLSCYQAAEDGPIPSAVLQSAAAIELVHNVSLVIDDMLDRSRFRRGELSLHCRFGSLPAMMVAGYMTAGASAIVADDPRAVRLLAELMQRLGAAECLQWRLRRHPLGVADWRAIASEDTGSMFEACARLGAVNDKLRRFGLLLGTLYHGCDDVADVRGTAALGGGSEQDISDGILTLPAAIAIRDPEIAVLFRRGGPDVVDHLTQRLLDSIPEAERVLDAIAREAQSEALRNAKRPDRLLALVEHTRSLSNAE